MGKSGVAAERPLQNHSDSRRCAPCRAACNVPVPIALSCVTDADGMAKGWLAISCIFSLKNTSARPVLFVRGCSGKPAKIQIYKEEVRQTKGQGFAEVCVNRIISGCTMWMYKIILLIWDGLFAQLMLVM